MAELLPVLGFWGERHIAWWVRCWRRVPQGRTKKLGQLKRLQVPLRPPQVSIYVTCIYVTCFNRHKLLAHGALVQTSQAFKSKQVCALHHSPRAFPTPSQQHLELESVNLLGGDRSAAPEQHRLAYGFASWPPEAQLERVSKGHKVVYVFLLPTSDTINTSCSSFSPEPFVDPTGCPFQADDCRRGQASP